MPQLVAFEEDNIEPFVVTELNYKQYCNREVYLIYWQKL